MDDYLRGLKDDLERFNRLASAWAASVVAADDLSCVRSQQIEILRAHREIAAARLLEAQASPEKLWREAADRLALAWHDLSDVYANARAYFEPDL